MSINRISPTWKPATGSPIDWENPITRGLNLWVPFNQGNGPAQDCVNGLSFSPLGSAGWTHGKDGLHGKIASASSDDFLSVACPDTGLLGVITVYWRGYIGSVGAYRSFFGKCTSSGATNNPIDFYLNSASPYSIYLVRANASAENTIGVTSQPVMTVGFHTILAVCAANCQSAVYWIDGKKYASTLVVNSFTGAPTGGNYAWHIGRRPDGVVQFDGTVSLAAVWTRGLTDAEAMSVISNPWQVQQSSHNWYLDYLGVGGSSGSGAITLSALTVTGSGGFSAPGAGSITLGALSPIGAGTFTTTASGSVALAVLTVSGAGTSMTTGASLGSGAVTFGAFSPAGAGTFTTTALGAITLGSILVVGSSIPPSFYLPYEFTSVLIAAGNVNPFGIDPEQTTSIL